MIGRSSSSLADQQKYTSERIDEIMTMMQGVEHNNCIYYCTPRLFSGKLVKQAKLITKFWDPENETHIGKALKVTKLRDEASLGF